MNSEIKGEEDTDGERKKSYFFQVGTYNNQFKYNKI